jgi:hypothetical protein
MINLEAKTKLPRKEVAERLKKFFGKGGLGLEVCEETPQCLSFEGGGGYVTATVSTEGGKTHVTLVTQEWDYQVKEFVASLP